jgi:hypothetical protein
LYIFTHLSTIQQNEIESLDIHIDKVSGISFDKVFINCIDRIYVLTQKGTYVIDISDEILKSIKYESQNPFAD